MGRLRRRWKANLKALRVGSLVFEKMRAGWAKMGPRWALCGDVPEILPMSSSDLFVSFFTLH